MWRGAVAAWSGERVGDGFGALARWMKDGSAWWGGGWGGEDRWRDR